MRHHDTQVDCSMATVVPLVLLLVASAAAGVDAYGAADPVRVDYYMESLCPYCANFTLTQLQQLFTNKLINHVQLDIIPYGNARTDPNTGAVTCQHGQVECAMNKMLSCAIAFNPVQDDYFPFVACAAEAALKGIKADEVEKVAHQCAIHAGLPPTKLMACYSGQLGDSLQRLAAQRTASLKPAHQWVPWVVVNGIPLLDDDENLMRYICVAYRGRDRPKVCLEMPGPPAPSAAAAVKQQQQERYKRCKLSGAEQEALLLERRAVQATVS